MIRGRTSRRLPPAALRRAAAGALAMLTVTSSTGCYVRRPAPAPTAPGSTLVVVLNDRGRAELASVIGPDVDRLEGRVVSTTDSTVVLSMRSSRTFGGGETRWTGERVEFRPLGARGYEQRVLSRGRTIATVGGAALAIVALIVTRTLDIGGRPEREPPGQGPGNEQ